MIPLVFTLLPLIVKCDKLLPVDTFNVAHSSHRIDVILAPEPSMWTNSGILVSLASWKIPGSTFTR